MRANGFTLVELLAALVAGSLLLAALSWTMRDMVAELARSDERRAADDLAEIAPTLEALVERADPGAFEGSARRMAITVPPPRAAGAAGPVRLVLEVRRDRAGEELLARFEPKEGAWPAAARERVLAAGWREIGFEYLAGDPRAGPLPRLVTIRFDDGERVRRISAEPRLNSDGACRFDPISMECRA